jgi:hypothetical protein
MKFLLLIFVFKHLKTTDCWRIFVISRNMLLTTRCLGVDQVTPLPVWHGPGYRSLGFRIGDVCYIRYISFLN